MVAADAGVSHPTVLHHFGSRDLLVKAVIARSLQAINATLVEAIGADRLMCLMQFGSIPHREIIRSIELTGEHLIGASAHGQPAALDLLFSR